MEGGGGGGDDVGGSMEGIFSFGRDLRALNRDRNLKTWNNIMRTKGGKTF